MPEKISNEDRMELCMWQARVEAAQGRLELAQSQYDATAKRVTTAHNMAPTDSLNLATGEITRGLVVRNPEDAPEAPKEEKPEEPAT